MKFSKGYKVPDASTINEEYEVKDKCIVANVSDQNIKKVLFDFINALEEPAFFFLELPLNQSEEKKLRKKDTDPFHNAIYYIDGCTKDKLLLLLTKSGDLLINDGLSSFGFASHMAHEEIMCSKYNVVTIFSRNISKNTSLLDRYGLNQVDKIKTAWDTFSESSYGEASAMITEGKDVYSILEDYKDWGIYQAEIREG